MEKAAKSGVDYLILLAPDELERGVVLVKDMEEGEQVEVSFDKLQENFGEFFV